MGSDMGKTTTKGKQIGEEEERKHQAGSQGKEENKEKEEERIWSWDKCEVVLQ